MQPLIGIPSRPGTRTVRNHDRAIEYSNTSYIRAIESAGGMPILIPTLQDTSALQALLPHLDGLVLAGGMDIHPSNYHQQPHPLLGETSATLDTLEFALARWAIEKQLPTLGICRGMQLLNIALGGDMYQDLEEQCPGSLRHSSWDMPRGQFVHNVQIEAGSRMENIFEQRTIGANSLHHQGLRKLGAGVIISGRSEDGVPEMMEVGDHPFMLAVQCHPEELYRDEPIWARLFTTFIAACTHNKALPREIHDTSTNVEEYAA